MNKWKAGAKGRGSRGPKKVCHVPCAVCGSFCVIGWLFFRLYQSQALLCGVRTTKLKVEMRVQPMEKKKVYNSQSSCSVLCLCPTGEGVSCGGALPSRQWAGASEAQEPMSVRR